MPDDQDLDKIKDEYDVFFQYRKIFSAYVLGWEKLFIPLSAVIIIIFVSVGTTLDNATRDGFMIIGWIILSFYLFYWRWLANKLDNAIVDMYPRMIKLEKELGWEFTSQHYYGRLNDESRTYFLDELDINEKEMKGAKTKVSEFMMLKEMKGDAIYDSLLKVWKKFGFESCPSKFHRFQDIGVFIAIAIYFIALIIVIAFY